MIYLYLGKSVGEGHFVGLGQRGDPCDGLLSGPQPLPLLLEPVLLQQRGEEEEELGLGQSLPETLPLAHREGDEVLVPLDIARLIQEPLGSEHLPIAPVVT